MKALVTVLVIGLLNVLPRPRSQTDAFRYIRNVTITPIRSGSAACTVLDAEVYAHATASLKDLRLFSNQTETPYAITLSQPVEAESEAALIRNLGERQGQVIFDLAMPHRAYTEVFLDLDAHDFLASADVLGSSETGPATHLGTFTLFDLTHQHLGRGTSLPLQESNFPLLHIALRFSPAPGAVDPTPRMAAVRGASVPPSREAQTRYTPVAVATKLEQQGKETVARFSLPAHVPVERIAVELPPEFAGNFSRDVTVTAHTAAAESAATESAAAGTDERLSGLIERVRLERAGVAIRQEQLAFPATLGANLQADATVEVRIENGDDPPLPLRAVHLEMRERRLCFPVAGEANRELVYGDPTREAPRYDFARTFLPSTDVLRADLSAEELNRNYIHAVDPEQAFLDRHPEALWIALLGVVCVLAVVATHSARRMPR